MSGLVTLERLKELLDYDPETGIFVWRVTRGGNSKEGWPAGRMGTGKAAGYMRINVDGREYKAHRLAWFYVTEEWPKLQIDHENTIASDNRFDNLRLATGGQNKANSKVYKNSKSGIKGVSWRAGAEKWVAVIYVGRKQRFLGYFDNIGDAAAAYRKAAQEHFGAFART